MSMNGQSTSDCALATGCGPLSDLLEKKLAILSLNDGELAGAAGAGAGGGGAAAVCGPVAGTEPVVTGAPILLLPVQPAASSTVANVAATGRRSQSFIGRKSRSIPNSSLSSRIRSEIGTHFRDHALPIFRGRHERDAQDFIPSQPWPTQG